MDDNTQAYGTAVAIAVVVLILGIALGVRISDVENVRKYCNYLQERRTTDSLTIKQLRKQLLYADTLVVETTYVDASIVKQRYRKGDSIFRVW